MDPLDSPATRRPSRETPAAPDRRETAPVATGPAGAVPVGTPAPAPGAAFVARWRPWIEGAAGRRSGLALLFVALTVAMLGPTPRELTDTLPNDLGDPALVVWILSWGWHSLTTDPLAVLDAPIFWDHPNALAFSDPLLPLAVPHGVLAAVTGNAVLAANLLGLGLVVLNLAATFTLGRRVLGRGDAALVAALIAAFNPYTLGQQSHLQLQTMGVIPLAFLALFVLFERERPVHGLWLGLASVTITLNALYYGALWFVVLGLIVAVEVVRRRGRLSRGLWMGLGLAAGVSALVLGPLALAYRAVSHQHGGQRGYQPTNALLPRDLLTVARGNRLWGTSLDDLGSLRIPGDHAFFMGLTAYVLGLIGVVVVAAGLWRRWRHRTPTGAPSVVERGVRWRELGYLVGAGLVSSTLALGPSPGGLPGPYRAFYHFVPGFDGIRVTSRLVVIAIGVGALVAGLGFAALSDRLRARGGARVGLLALVSAVVLVEAYGPGHARAEVPDVRGRTAVYDELARRPEGPVLELPMADPGRGLEWPFVEAPRMLFATADFNPRVNGYSGFFPDTYLSDVDLLNRVPEPAALDRLDDLDVRYLVLHLGLEQEYPALTDDEARAVIAGLPAGAASERVGDAWLVDLRAAG